MIIEPRTLPLAEMPFHVCLIYACWILGMLCAPKAERERYTDRTAEEGETEWITNWIGTDD